MRVLVNATKSAFHVYGNSGRSFVLTPAGPGQQARNAVYAIIHAETQPNRRVDEAVRLGHLKVVGLSALSGYKAANVGIMFDASCKPASNDGPLTSPYCTPDFLRRFYPDIADSLGAQQDKAKEEAAAKVAEEPPANPLAVAAGTASAPGAPINKEFAFRRDLPDDRLGVCHDGSNVTFYVNRSGAFIITPINKIAEGDLFRISRKDGSFVTHNDVAVFKALTSAKTDDHGNATFECVISTTSQPNTEKPRAEVVTAPQITSVKPVTTTPAKRGTTSTRSSSIATQKG